MSTIQTTTSSTKSSLSPAVGDTYFETDTKNIIVYDGTAWRGYQSDGAFGSGTFTSNSYSAYFDGTNDYIETGNKFDFIQQTCNFSLTFWMKLTDYTTAANQFLLANDEAFIWYDNRGGTSISQNALRMYLGSPGFDATNAITDNDWHHIAATCSASGSIKLYVDGSQILSTTAPSTNSNSSTNNLRFGSFTSNTSYLGGYLDEVAIFNRELTSTEISNIISNKAYSNFSAMYRLENNADDEVGLNNGSNNGATFVTSEKPY